MNHVARRSREDEICREMEVRYIAEQKSLRAAEMRESGVLPMQPLMGWDLESLTNAVIQIQERERRVYGRCSW